MAAAGFLLGLPIVAFGIWKDFASGWDGRYSFFFGSQSNYWAAIVVDMGWIGAIMLFCKSDRLMAFRAALGALGRTAFSNYILQTLICSAIFYGNGFGLFGAVTRVQQLLIIVAIWIVQLSISPLWLRHFLYGPLEWLWRSLTYLATNADSGSRLKKRRRPGILLRATRTDTRIVSMLASILVAVALWAPSAQTGTLTFTKPAAWTDRAAASSMRVAEFVVPKTSGDTEDGEVIVYYFGGGGGSVEANLQRWMTQVQSTKEPTRTTATVNGLKLTSLDITGTYVAEMSPALLSATTSLATGCAPPSSRRQRVRTSSS